MSKGEQGVMENGMTSCLPDSLPTISSPGGGAGLERGGGVKEGGRGTFYQNGGTKPRETEIPWNGEPEFLMGQEEEAEGEDAEEEGMAYEGEDMRIGEMKNNFVPHVTSTGMIVGDGIAQGETALPDDIAAGQIYRVSGCPRQPNGVSIFAEKSPHCGDHPAKAAGSDVKSLSKPNGDVGSPVTWMCTEQQADKPPGVAVGESDFVDDSKSRTSPDTNHVTSRNSTESPANQAYGDGTHAEGKDAMSAKLWDGNDTGIQTGFPQNSPISTSTPTTNETSRERTSGDNEPSTADEETEKQRGDDSSDGAVPQPTPDGDDDDDDGDKDGEDAAADNQQENIAKSVTFAEDKEVFDMGYVLPASVTVHLDTPVSSIAPGDVQVSTDAALPACDPATAYPISGILKTDEITEGREEAAPPAGAHDQPGIETSGSSRDREPDALSNAGLERESPSCISKPSELRPDCVGDCSVSTVVPVEADAGALVTPKLNLLASDGPEEAAGGDTEPASRPAHASEDGGEAVAPGDGSTTASPGHNIADEPEDARQPAAGEEGEGTACREFTVESVPEHELLLADDGGVPGVAHARQSDGAVRPYSLLANGPRSAAAAADGGSHSTDSNYQDTIGPLDNPQFLKTLNYTASQAFDQDEHFGLHSAGLDARSLAGLQEPADLDAGWAWVVLTASFLGLTLLGATVYAAGVLMGAILEQVENDLTKASWVGSVFVCVMSFSGPFVGSVLTRVGARLTVSCAGIILTLGFIGASLSTSIVQLILTHGCVAGLGAGFLMNPLFVTVGQYFNKYRGFACGILAMGAGAGMLGGGAFVSYLLSVFDLSGVYLIWAGVMLHVTPVGLLLLPSPEERVRQVEKDITIGDLKSLPDAASVNSGPNSLFGSVNQSMLSGIDRISVGAHGRRMIIPGSLVSRRPAKTSGLSNTSGDAEVPLLKAALHNEMSRSSHSVNRSSGYVRSSLNKSSSDICGPLSPMVNAPPAKTPILEGQELLMPYGTTASASQNYLSASSNLSPSSNTLNSLAMTSPSGGVVPYSRNQSQLYGQLRPPSSAQGPQSQYTSISHISARLSLRSGLTSTAPRGELDNESFTSAFVSSLRPRDTLSPRHPLGSRSISTLLGSVASFPTSLAIVKDDLRRFEPVGPYDGSLKGSFIAILDSMRILRNKPFCIFALTNFFWALGESPVMIYLPSYVISQGTSVMEASSLYTSMGVASMAGRFLSGLVASDANIGPVLIYTGSLGVAGLVVLLSPLITATFAQQVVFSFLVGLYTGALVPLTSLITIELLGISELPLGFGIICMSQGIGYLIGPPLTSVVIHAIGFLNAFVCSAFVLMGGSLLALSMTLFLTVADTDDELGLDPQDEDRHPLGDLQRALQKLADSDNSDLDRERHSIVTEDAADCGDGRSQTSEKSRGNIGDERMAVCDDAAGKTRPATNNALSREDAGPRTLADCVILVEEQDALLQSAGQSHVVAEDASSMREGTWGPSAGVQGLYADEAPAPVRAFDELDTILEVVGK